MKELLSDHPQESQSVLPVSPSHKTPEILSETTPVDSQCSILIDDLNKGLGP